MILPFYSRYIRDFLYDLSSSSGDNVVIRDLGEGIVQLGLILEAEHSPVRFRVDTTALPGADSKNLRT